MTLRPRLTPPTMRLEGAAPLEPIASIKYTGAFTMTNDWNSFCFEPPTIFGVIDMRAERLSAPSPEKDSSVALALTFIDAGGRQTEMTAFFDAPYAWRAGHIAAAINGERPMAMLPASTPSSDVMLSRCSTALARIISYLSEAANQRSQDQLVLNRVTDALRIAHGALGIGPELAAKTEEFV